MSLHRISDQLKTRAMVRGGTLIFSPPDALALIDEAKSKGVNILGIDAFILTDKSTQPDMENSANYSSQADKGLQMHDVAREFISVRANLGFHFEIVLSDH